MSLVYVCICGEGGRERKRESYIYVVLAGNLLGRTLVIIQFGCKGEKGTNTMGGC